VVLDHADLQDNPKKWWDEKRIQEIVAPYIKKWDADLVKNPRRTFIARGQRVLTLIHRS
jgi:hypothetical protein